MSIVEYFRSIPPCGLPLWQIVSDEDDVDRDIASVVSAISKALAEEGIEARVTFRLVKQYRVPDSILEEYGVRTEYEPEDAYTETIYRINIVSGDVEQKIYYIPEHKEMGYFFSSFADAREAAKDEIDTLIEWIEYMHGEG